MVYLLRGRTACLCCSSSMYVLVRPLMGIIEKWEPEFVLMGCDRLKWMLYHQRFSPPSVQLNAAVVGLGYYYRHTPHLTNLQTSNFIRNNEDRLCVVKTRKTPTHMYTPIICAPPSLNSLIIRSHCELLVVGLRFGSSA